MQQSQRVLRALVVFHLACASRGPRRERFHLGGGFRRARDALAFLPLELFSVASARLALETPRAFRAFRPDLGVVALAPRRVRGIARVRRVRGHLRSPLHLRDVLGVHPRARDEQVFVRRPQPAMGGLERERGVGRVAASNARGGATTTRARVEGGSDTRAYLGERDAATERRRPLGRAHGARGALLSSSLLNS